MGENKEFRGATPERLAKAVLKPMKKSVSAKRKIKAPKPLPASARPPAA